MTHKFSLPETSIFITTVFHFELFQIFATLTVFNVILMSVHGHFISWISIECFDEIFKTV